MALGVKAIKNGFSVQHYVLDDLMHLLKGDAAIPPRRLRAKRYLNSSLLLTTAILDRLLHHVHILHIDGRSYRLREIDGLLKQPNPSPQNQGGERKTA